MGQSIDNHRDAAYAEAGARGLERLARSDNRRPTGARGGLPPATGTFLGDIQGAEAATPLLPPGDPNFMEAATQRGVAVAAVIVKWLAHAPYRMFQELRDLPEDSSPIWKPLVGPVIVARHKHVLRCLERHDLFTVDLYASEMKKATDGNFVPGAYAHFMLGTDDEQLYRPDGVLLRHVVRPDDATVIRGIARKSAEWWAQQFAAKPGQSVDITTTIARFVPLDVIAHYLGVPAIGDMEPFPLDPSLTGGSSFPLDPELVSRFTFSTIEHGTIPTREALVAWIREAFRNLFQNFAGNPEIRAKGLEATENISAYLDLCVRRSKALLAQGRSIGDSVLARLVKLQAEYHEDPAGVAARTGISADELGKRLRDGHIRSNLFGTVVGAHTNPEEAMTRVMHAICGLKDGQHKAAKGTSYRDLRQFAADDALASQKMVRRYALEALRLEPQGEVLIRRCAVDNAELGGVSVAMGTTVFAAIGSAMHDEALWDEPMVFDAHRSEALKQFDHGGDRPTEQPQSQNYLHHGYGRHKCLGRYASEITIQETLRALMRLGDIERASEITMDEYGHFPISFMVRFT